MEQATRYANQIAKVENDNALEMVKKSGKTQVHTPTAAERQAFKKTLVPVHQKMESRVGKETIQAVYKATGFDPNKL
jgi:C4-dicarboxylate-binding protein DctP